MTHARRADFDSIQSFGRSLWTALYEDVPPEEENTPVLLLEELSITPSLVVVDDLDTVLDNQELADFLLYDLRSTKSKVIYTSRQRIPGIRTIDVRGFNSKELDAFLRSRAREHGLSVDACLERQETIMSVTDGFPLFVDDLLRHARLTGLMPALGDWNQKRGDTAREYSLRRQLDRLGEVARRVLIGAAVATRPVSSLELRDISGFGVDDVEAAIRDLENWRLLNRGEMHNTGVPTFVCNRNTTRLVQKTFGGEAFYKAYEATFRSLEGSTLPRAHRRSVGVAIADARVLVRSGDIAGAADRLLESMDGELENSADMWGALGWVYCRRADLDSIVNARNAFERAHALGATKEDTYFHWVTMEMDVAESMVNQVGDDSLLNQWHRGMQIVERGVGRCGETAFLCQTAAYLKTREAKTRERLGLFTSAHTCFNEGAEWARRGLRAQGSSSREVGRSRLHRSLVVALEGAEEFEPAIRALEDWRRDVGDDDFDWRRERDRLAGSQELRDLLP